MYSPTRPCTMLYSPTCQRALRALTYLARHADRGPILVREIAREEGFPQPFLSKIMHGLRTKGLVTSTMGPGGGYRLARPPDEIPVTDIITAMDGQQDLEKICIMGLDECSDEESCALHDHWVRFREEYLATISELTLADLARTLALKRNHRKTS
jgi:Rrf2 family protein